MKNGAALLASMIGEVEGSAWSVSQIYLSRDGRRGDPVWHARVKFWGKQIETNLSLDEKASEAVRRAVRRAGYGPNYPMRALRTLGELATEVRRIDRVLDGAEVGATFGRRALPRIAGREGPIPAPRIARALEGFGPEWWVRMFVLSRREVRGDLTLHGSHLVADEADYWRHQFDVQVDSSPTRPIPGEVKQIQREVGRTYRNAKAPADHWAVWFDRRDFTRTQSRRERARLDRVLFKS